MKWRKEVCLFWLLMSEIYVWRRTNAGKRRPKIRMMCYVWTWERRRGVSGRPQNRGVRISLWPTHRNNKNMITHLAQQTLLTTKTIKNNKRLNPNKLTKILNRQVQKRRWIFYSKKSSQIAFCCAIAIALPCPFGHRYFLPNPYHFLCHK